VVGWVAGCNDVRERMWRGKRQPMVHHSPNQPTVERTKPTARSRLNPQPTTNPTSPHKELRQLRVAPQLPRIQSMAHHPAIRHLWGQVAHPAAAQIKQVGPGGNALAVQLGQLRPEASVQVLHQPAREVQLGIGGVEEGSGGMRWR